MKVADHHKSSKFGLVPTNLGWDARLKGMMVEQTFAFSTDPKTFFLHIGLPKTATSYLQQALFDNCEVIRKAGIVYFCAVSPSQLPDGIPFGTYPRLRDENSPETIKMIIAHCAKQLSGSVFATGLFSNERICYFGVAWIEELCALIPDNVELKIILTTRNQRDMVNSLYIEQNHDALSVSFADVDGNVEYDHVELGDIQSVARMLEFGSGMDLINRACDFYTIALNWASYINKSNIKVLVYEESRSILNDFFCLDGAERYTAPFIH
ncbi:MAG: hypothetical protein HC888_06640 [Candidatus Competibacteraceae bacterium]|nr:hypothetical protein [Candidatus Competibacteraceae bacterium]